MKFGEPEILVLCIAARILPKSCVIVIFTSGIFPARVMTPTVLSGLDWVLAVKRRLTASDCAPNRVGVKSPFRVCSELSTLAVSEL